MGCCGSWEVQQKIWLLTVPREAGIDGGGLPECPVVVKPSPGSALLGQFQSLIFLLFLFLYLLVYWVPVIIANG